MLVTANEGQTMKSLPKRTLLIVVLLWMTTPTHADPVMECGAQHGSQVEISGCLAEVEKISNLAMETALGFTMNAARELDEVTDRKVAVPALETGQASWLQYRENHCNYVGATFGGGSGTGIAIRSCRIGLTRTRTDELMKFAQ